MATWLKQDGTQMKIKPQDGKRFTYGELKNFVGGHIAQDKTRDGRFLVMNNTGKLNPSCRKNAAATELYVWGHSQVIVGDVVLVDKVDELPLVTEVRLSFSQKEAEALTRFL